MKRNISLKRRKNCLKKKVKQASVYAERANIFLKIIL